MLAAQFTTRVGDFEILATVEVSDSEIVAIVGPNGAGKSTILRAVAGLQPLKTGSIVVDEEPWEDVDRGIRLSPESRRVGLVPQDGLLFPHLTIADNVAFGARSAELADRWLAQVGLTTRAGSRPGDLSGGQRQLVAVARALAREPRVLLLDEPLASVDASHRPEVRKIVREQLRATPTIRLIVTHDAVEAAALADRIIVLEAGRITQVGTLHDLRNRPRSEYVAALVGVNYFRGIAREGTIAVEPRGTLIAAQDIDGEVLATIHPRAVALHTTRPTGSPRNVFALSVASVEPSLDRVRIELTGELPLVAEVTHAGSRGLGIGTHVWGAIKASEVMVYPR